MPWLFRSSASPMPESMRICGELTAPAESTISRAARARMRLAAALVIDADRPALLDDDALVSAWVATVRFGRFIAGRRKARDVLQRLPLRMVKS